MAVAFVATAVVFASSSRSARRFGAVIDQLTAYRGFTRITWLTTAHLRVMFGGAYGIVSTRIMCQAGNSTDVHIANLFFGTVVVRRTFNGLTSHFIVVSIAKESLLARAVPNMIVCFALGVSSAQDGIT